jgi:HlyD family secretion protein
MGASSARKGAVLDAIDKRRANVGSTIAPTRKVFATVAACGFVLAAAAAVVAPEIGTEVARRATAAETPDKKLWQAVAPGRVEPQSGEIRIAAPVMGRIGAVLVGVNDKVFAGQPLMRLEDEETHARLLAAQVQIELRKRARNEQRSSSRAASRREAEDAVAESEQAVVEARSALDKAAAAKSGGDGSDARIETARTRLTRARDLLESQKTELRRLEIESGAPLPTQAEGQLNIARAELLGVQAALEKLTVRAPIDGTVLRVNARAGELATPSAAQPLLLLGDISAMRVRAELDERDFGGIKIGQTVTVRSAAFPEREFAGTVLSIAPTIQSSRISSGDQRNLTDVNVAEVVVELAEPGPLTDGMKVDVYFRNETRDK